MKLTPRPYQPARLILITYFMVLIALLQCRKIHHTFKAATNKSKVFSLTEPRQTFSGEPRSCPAFHSMFVGLVYNLLTLEVGAVFLLMLLAFLPSVVTRCPPAPLPLCSAALSLASNPSPPHNTRAALAVHSARS